VQHRRELHEPHLPLCDARPEARHLAQLLDLLHELHEAHRPLAAALNRAQVAHADAAGHQPRAEDSRRRDGILYREVDPDPEHRRENVRGVADQQEPWPVPLLDVTDLDHQQ
jgi:hypothetical protein